MNKMLLTLTLGLILGLSAVFAPFSTSAARAAKSPKPTPTPTPTLSITQTPVLTPTPTPTPAPVVGIKGVEYNPIGIGTNQLDAAAPLVDLSQISQLGANTVGTYNVGKYDWQTLTNVDINGPFYLALATEAEKYQLKLILGYFSNATVDWTNATVRARLTTQYQQLVTQTKDRPSTYMYLLGNEVFENLPTTAARQAYALWLGQMADWTHAQNPKLLVTYADNHALLALPYLKASAPNLDVYSLNTYEWNSEAQLLQIIDRVIAAWPAKNILLHEWGVDSYNGQTSAEDQSTQANQVGRLAQIIANVQAQRPQLIGSLYFEYTDQWDKMGNPASQDQLAVNWTCTTCFDGLAHEEYWGLAKNMPAGGTTRTLKSAFSALQSLWK